MRGSVARGLWAALFGVALVAALAPAALGHAVLPPAAVAPAALPATSNSVDISHALAADGTFVGSAGLDGKVDTRAWRLVSDLAKGDPPRFAPTSGAVPSVEAASVGPQSRIGWEPFGRSGTGNGQVATGDVNAVAVQGDTVFIRGS